MNFLPVNTYGNNYIPTFRDFQQDDENLRLLLSTSYTEIANSVNIKENGVYDLVEVQNSQQFFNLTTPSKKRFAFRILVLFGAIAAGNPSSVAHGVKGITMCTHIYGTCITDIPDFRPIPHASVTANANIEVIVSSTTVTVNVGAGSPNVTSAMIVLEYLKN